MNPIKKILKSKEAELIYTILVFILVFYVIGHWFYDCVSLHLDAYNNFWIYNAEDVDINNQIAWNTAKGKLFQYNFQEPAETISTPQYANMLGKNTNTLGYHSELIYLLILPFYLMLPHLASFIISQSLFLSLSGLGLYLVAREMFTEKKILPVLIFFMYMCYFPLTCVSHYWHTEEFSIVFIFFMFYFYLRDSLKPAMLFAILGIFCREDIALVVAVLGIVSYFRPQKRRFFLPFTLLGIISFLFIIFILFTVFKAPYSSLDRHYGYLGGTALLKLRNIFIHPELVLNNVLRADRIKVFKDTFGAVLYLPFLSPLLFMPGLIILTEVMLTQVDVAGILWIYPWYLCALIPFIFIALIGTFEKIYRLGEINKNILTRFNFCGNRIFNISAKILSFLLIFVLFFYIYIKNRQLSEIDYGKLKKHFSINRYWHADTFEALSALREDTRLRVTCPYNLTPMLSSREFVMPIRYLNDGVANRGFYDVIIISESVEIEDINKFNFVKESGVYKNIYYTPQISVFSKADKAIPMIGNWKFDLISGIKDYSLRCNYVFLDFIDYSTILENSNAIEPEELVSGIYRDSNACYDVLGRVEKIAQFQPDDSRIVYFVSDKPLDKGYSYILVFAAKAEEGKDTLVLAGPAGSIANYTEIRIDKKLRLYMIPFKVGRSLESCKFLIQKEPASFVTKPILLRSPSNYGQSQPREPILEITVNKHKISYDPWLKPDIYKKQLKNPQFLIRYLEKNPMIYFMELFHFSIPKDLYKYRWVSEYRGSRDILAVRY